MANILVRNGNRCKDMLTSINSPLLFMYVCVNTIFALFVCSSVLSFRFCADKGNVGKLSFSCCSPKPGVEGKIMEFKFNSEN